ncbi:protein IQ-domain 26-like [Nymphaea colorata]|nr:protein IQ-domain 26-like [Nymphaea colorata]XP_031483192.1 protein IQ-domain 26-like [Nymphaea colorata]
MGRATRWLRSLWGGKKDTEKSTADRKEKRRWSFGKPSSKGTGAVPPVPIVSEGWAQSYRDVFFTEAEKEQSKHAIVVAAATAAAADAAVAAAQAAAAVVRLTSHSRNTAFTGTSREHWAAIRIQTMFRGYLAKKALRALKGLVKLQAHVRGYLVRKEAAATLHSMQALFRAQATMRLRQARSSHIRDPKFLHEACPRRSMERFDETRSENMPSIHSRRISASIENGLNGPESPKIVEIDTFRTKSRPRRRNLSASESFTFSPPFEACSYHPPIIPASSPLMPVPGRLSVPDSWSLNWSIPGDECRFSTAQSTPRFSKSSMQDIRSTPTKSVCGDGVRRRYSNSPNYMANTQSSRAKVRSQSAPKQRPDPLTKRRLSLQEAVEARASLSGVRMQRSSSQAAEPFSFKNTVVNRLDRSTEPSPCWGLDRDYLVSLQTRW